MKIKVCIALFTFLQIAIAEAAQICGTTNQWPNEKQSGWFLEIDPKAHTAWVTQYEDATTVRSYDYAVESTDTGLKLASRYETTLELKKNETGYSAKYSYKNSSENFDVVCFARSKLSQMHDYDSPFMNTQIGKFIAKQQEDKQPGDGLQNFFFVQKADIPFPIAANVLGHTMSRVGDWEQTVLTKEQTALIDSGLALSPEDQKRFQELKDLIQSDIAKMPGMKQVGYVFGRDWYYGDGTIGFVLAYKQFLVLVPFDYSSDARFNDERLDHTY